MTLVVLGIPASVSLVGLHLLPASLFDSSLHTVHGVLPGMQ